MTSPILTRIKQALEGAEVEPLPDETPSFPEVDDRVERFGRELTAVGGRFFDARETPLVEILEVILGEVAASQVFWEAPSSLEKHGLRFEGPSGLQGEFLLFSTHDDGSFVSPIPLEARPHEKENLAEAVLSVSEAECAVAETGTVVHQVGSGKGRLLSVLPPNHIALVPQSRILANHAEFFDSIAFGSKGSVMTLTTGPSRTADIEKTLVVGVHGPKRFYAVVTDC